eukprot:CAMPEP_0198284762 /NCGR_PEP_ID=MMETSP1449-20131203/4202_1 /TAXON_ID=420275 /ORGANISM="Attheya septentrionalis, Strain CCMP2084" /LENGTH=314 /DNA_ID=CAMNT_0043981975 /DNA_START=201 /DNA_END=1142 /DNA_ORIENTATION=+
MAKTKLGVIRDLLSVSSQLTYPGFGRALGTDPTNVLHHLEDLVHYNDSSSTLTFKYTIPPHAVRRGGEMPLSGFLAVFDEVTTWAIVAQDRKRRPGLSITLSAQVGPATTTTTTTARRGIQAGDTVQINAKVVKSGKVLAFTEAEAIDVTTGDVICTGRHTKYLPMPFLFELGLGPLFPLVKMYTNRLPPKYNDDWMDPTIDDLLQFKDMSANHKTGTFHVENDHNNPLGSVHGGCQAMGIEMIGQGYADASLKTPMRLHSITTTYMSTGRKEITFDANWIHVANDSASMSVKVASISGIPVSEGILHFVPIKK